MTNGFGPWQMGHGACGADEWRQKGHSFASPFFSPLRLERQWNLDRENHSPIGCLLLSPIPASSLLVPSRLSPKIISPSTESRAAQAAEGGRILGGVPVGGGGILCGQPLGGKPRRRWSRGVAVAAPPSPSRPLHSAPPLPPWPRASDRRRGSAASPPQA
jgi:hypothetical protein